MILIEEHTGFAQQHSGCVATIGKFDGVHLGHQAILRQVRDKAEQLGLPSLVILMEPHPEEFFAASSQLCPARLNNLEEKLAALESMQVEYVYLLRFDLALSQLSAEDYIKSILVDGLGIAAFIVGSDFRFGNQRKGDFTMLKESGAHFGFDVIETASCEVGGQRVSSTYIRAQLEAGNFPLVEQLLGRPYAMTGEVVEGRKLGRDLGFPTCNVNLHRQRIPLHGVYVCEVKLGTELIPAAVNIGYRPTITSIGNALLEAHLLDFDGDLYGQRLEVVFRKKIREEEKFDELETLIRQIAIDVQQTREYFSN
ncbi:MAG: bifunctional riboflavin kinase/FAD synthetase [Gammaproteobacteria bacterium]|nr:bifunctional riboflavin kinase/FAD synthetase [Gammaproteobacteria bacterium]